MDNFHYAPEHTSKVQLYTIAEQQGIVIEGELLEFRGCSMTKLIRKIIKPCT